MNYFYKPAHLLCATFFIFNGTVLAAENSNDVIVEHTITVANRYAIPEREISASVSVLDENDLKQLGYLNLGDALANMPSVSISNNGGLGKTTSLSVRGEAGFRTLVLVDGISINDPSAPQSVAQLEHLLTKGISRIEVLRGPHGMAYGADAGGVILISTTDKKQNGFGGTANIETGSYSTNNVGGDLAFNNENFGFSISGSHLNTDGFNSSVADSVSPDDDAYENTSLHGKFAVKITDDLNIEAVAHSTEGESDYDGCYNADFDFVHDCSSDYDQQSRRIALNVDKFGSHQLAINESEITRNNFSEGDFSFGAEGATQKIEYLGHYQFTENTRVTLGADLSTEELSDVELERDQRGVFLEYQSKWADNTFVNLGLRRDNNDDFGNHNSVRVGAAQLFEVNSKDELKLKASYGTGFRAPSIYEEYLNTFGPADLPELHEESSRGFDLGLSYFSENNLQLELVYFDQQVEDEIYYDLVNYSGYLQGQGESDSSGVELIADILINTNWSYNLNYTYTDSKDDSGSIRSRVPKHSGKLGVRGNWLDTRLSMAMNLRANADIYDAAAQSWQPNYQVLDANVRFQMTKLLEIYLRIENLLDKEYQSVPGYYAAESSVYGGLSLQF